MRKFDFEGTLKSLRRATAGGWLGAALGIAAYLTVRPIRQATDLQTAIGVGATLGTASGRLLAPLLSCLWHYVRMIQIEIELKAGWMTARRADKIREKLQDEYYLGTHS